MADHVLVPDRARRGLRTFITVTLAVIVTLLGLVPVVLQAVEPLRDALPDGWYAGLVAIAGTVVLVATAIQRILTSAPIEQLLQDKAPKLAATSPDGAAVITSLTPDQRTNLTQLHDALDEGDPGRVALAHILTTTTSTGD